MSILIEEDYSQLGGGHALVSLGVSLGGADPAIRITRLDGEPDQLGTGGWQASGARLQPAEVHDEPGGTVLLLGPEVCDFLDDNAEITFSVPSVGLSEVLIWPYIAPSVDREKRLGAAGSTTQTPQPAPVPPKPAPPPPPPKQAELPDETPEGNGLKTDTGQIDEPEPNGEDEETQGSGGKRGWLIVVLAVLAAVVIAAGATLYMYPELLPGNDSDDIVVPGPTPAPDTVVTLTPEEQAQQAFDAALACMSADCPPEEFFGYGQEIAGLGFSEMAFRVMSTASAMGSGDAQLWMGTLYDPASFDPDIAGPIGIEESDPAEALSFYNQASAAGLDAAQTRKDALCTALADFAEGLGGGDLALPESLTADTATGIRTQGDCP